MDVAAGSKVVRFIQLCDTFHLPMVYFVDEPGFMVGPEQQELGILRAGARMLTTTLRTQIPWFTILTRQAYGVAGQCHDRPTGLRTLPTLKPNPPPTFHHNFRAGNSFNHSLAI